MEADNKALTVEEYLEASKGWELRHEWVDGDSHSLVNPRIIVEVLSPSTREYDIGKKLERYVLVDTVSDVLLVDPDRSHVIHHARTEEGWLRRDIREGAVRITGIEGLELPLDEIYADLDSIPATQAAEG